MSNFYRCCKKASGTKDASISSNGTHIISGLTDYDSARVVVSVPTVQFPSTLTLSSLNQSYSAASGTFYGGDLIANITIPKFLCANYSTFTVSSSSGGVFTAGSSTIKLSTSYPISSYTSNGTLTIENRISTSAPVISGSFQVTLSR